MGYAAETCRVQRAFGGKDNAAILHECSGHSHEE